MSGPVIKDKVTIHGLNKAAEFNGKEGRIVSFEEDTGRFVVQLTSNKRKISVKPGNLESIPSGSGGNSPGGDGMPSQEHMRNVINNTTPEQLRQRANQFKNMSSGQIDQLRRQHAQFKNMSDNDIRAMGDQMASMAKDPEMMKQVTEQVKNMTPEQMKFQQDMLKTMTPEQLKDIEKVQKKMSEPGVDQAAVSADLMKNMSSKQLSDLLKMQKNMLKSNPDMIKKMMANNPMMKNMTTEQLEQQLDMMADMDPKNLERIMAVTQGVQKYAAPLVKGYTLLNKVTGGRANAILLVGLMMGLYSLFNWLFFSASAVAVATEHFTPPDADINDNDGFGILDDEL